MDHGAGALVMAVTSALCADVQVVTGIVRRHHNMKEVCVVGVCVSHVAVGRDSGTAYAGGDGHRAAASGRAGARHQRRRGRLHGRAADAEPVRMMKQETCSDDKAQAIMAVRLMSNPYG